MVSSMRPSKLGAEAIEYVDTMNINRECFGRQFTKRLPVPSLQFVIPVTTVNSHWSNGTRGVGPADKTGKSVVTYCPGGSFSSSTLRRPEKPREMIVIVILPCKRSLVLPGADQGSERRLNRNCLPVI